MPHQPPVEVVGPLLPRRAPYLLNLNDYIRFKLFLPLEDNGVHPIGFPARQDVVKELFLRIVRFGDIGPLKRVIESLLYLFCRQLRSGLAVLLLGVPLCRLDLVSLL